MLFRSYPRSVCRRYGRTVPRLPTIVFDRENRTIFKQKGSGLKKILPFEEACLLLTETKGGCLYGIARKSDRYRSVQRLSGYMSEEELRAFEEEIAQKIQQMLEA